MKRLFALLIGCASLTAPAALGQTQSLQKSPSMQMKVAPDKALAPALSTAPALALKPSLAMKKPGGAMVKQATQEAISKTSFQVKGKSFPRIARAKSSGSCCQVGETRTVPGGSFLHDSPRRMKKTWNNTLETEHFSPTCWMTDYGQVNITTHGSPANYNTSKLAHNLSFNTNAEYNTALSSMNNYVFALDIPDTLKVDLKAKLEEFVANYQAMQYGLTSSHGGFRVTTTVHGTGRLNTQTAHSWIHGNITVTKTCCPPEFTDPDDLINGLRAWTDETVDNYITFVENADLDASMSAGTASQ